MYKTVYQAAFWTMQRGDEASGLPQDLGELLAHLKGLKQREQQQQQQEQRQEQPCDHHHQQQQQQNQQNQQQGGGSGSEPRSNGQTAQRE